MCILIQAVLEDKVLDLVSSYLDIKLDTGMTFLFLHHVRKQVTKAWNLFGKIGRLLRVSYGAISTVNLNIIYKTVFLPIMAHGYI